MSAAPLVANLRAKVASLSINPTTTSSTVAPRYFGDIKNDAAWGPSVAWGHTPYTWGVRGFTSAAPSDSSNSAPKAAAPVETSTTVTSTVPSTETPVEKKVQPKKEKKPAAAKPVEGPHAEFYKLDFRVGQVTNVRDHPGADSLYIFDAVVGEETMQCVTNVKKTMTKEELEGKFLTFLCNMKPIAFRGEKSFVMILGGTSADNAVHDLVVPSVPVAGERLFVTESESPVDLPARANDKAIAAAFAKLSTNDKNELTFDGKTVMTASGPMVMPKIAGAVFASK